MTDTQPDFSILDMNDMEKRAQLAETPEEIEARIEERWMQEFRSFNEDTTVRLNKAYSELAAWRNLLITALARDKQIDRSIIYSVMSEPSVLAGGAEQMNEEAKAIVDAGLEKLTTYLGMGMDFETIMTAVKSDDALQNSWDMFLVTMRLGGHDQPVEPDA